MSYGITMVEKIKLKEEELQFEAAIEAIEDLEFLNSLETY